MIRNIWTYPILLLALLIVPLRAAPPGASAQAAPTPVASYTMQVRLDPAAKTVSGESRITYRNPSPDTLGELWLRLYLKAFASSDTTWMREGGGQLRGFQADPAQLGDITLEALTLADGRDLLASATLSETLLRVPLPTALGPGESVELAARWTSKLPKVFARTGYGGANNDFFMVGQWYPKMTVYDRGRWDTEPWHANSEFFHDFGNYEVTITLPQEYVLAGAGVPAGEASDNGDGSKTQTYRSEGVTDYAFAASPHFKTLQGTAGAAEVVVYYLPEHANVAPTYLRSAIGALETFGAWYGRYPWPRMSIIDVPDDASGAGGMEYPTLVTAGAFGGIDSLAAYVTAHEVGHNWWPMQTATNEGREPWLDEGLTEYSGARYNAEAGDIFGVGRVGLSSLDFERQSYTINPKVASTRPAWEYTTSELGAGVYNKTAVALWTLERQVGSERLRAALAVYLERYRYRHPSGDDFRATLREQLGDEATGWFFAFLDGEGLIDYNLRRSTAGAGTVTVVREGEVRVPIEIVATFADGSTQTQRWDGATQQVDLSFTGSAPLRKVEADPAFKLVAEIDRLDNGITYQPKPALQVQLGTRLGFWSQVLTLLASLFG